MLCTQRGEIVNTFSRTEPLKDEYPGCIMATQIVNMAKPPHSPWKKAGNQTVPRVEKGFTQSHIQMTNCLTSVSQITCTAIATRDPTREETTDSAALSVELTRETTDESLLQSSLSEKQTSDNSLLTFSGDDACQFYEADQSEDTPYWLDYEREDSNTDGGANICFKTTGCSTSSLDVELLSKKCEPVTAQLSSPDAQDLYLTKNDNSSLTKTEQKIKHLKALLAEQEKLISRLKKESIKDRTSQSKEPCFALNEDNGYSLGASLYENACDKPVPNDDDFHEQLNVFGAASRRRKRISHAEHFSLSNTKRFRYHFRKDVPQEIKSYLNGTDEQKRTLFERFSSFQVFKPDIRRESFSQDEFLSFFSLVRASVANERMSKSGSNYRGLTRIKVISDDAEEEAEEAQENRLTLLTQKTSIRIGLLF